MPTEQSEESEGQASVESDDDDSIPVNSVGLQMSCMFKIEGRQSIKSIEIY